MIETLGNLGDFQGGLAVIATLIYLAIRVRQNTTQLDKSATLAELQAGDQSFRRINESTPEEIFELLGIERIARSPGTVRWSEANKGAFDAEFVGMIDGEPGRMGDGE